MDNISKIYIASSYTENNKAATCASDPSIDNYVKMCNCTTQHDQYDMTRIQKVNYIINYAKENKVYPSLRVCWESKGGKNCCKCEKCYRTIYEIIACKEDPNKYGFIFNDRINKEAKIYMIYKNILSATVVPMWKEIKEMFIEEGISDNEKYKWIKKLDLEKGNHILFKKCNRLKGRIIRKIKRIIKNI